MNFGEFYRMQTMEEMITTTIFLNCKLDDKISNKSYSLDYKQEFNANIIAIWHIILIDFLHKRYC